MSGLNVLIAEDYTEMQQIITEAILSIDTSCNIFTAVSADEGWRIAQENHIDLFIIDITLVGSSGFELAGEIRGSQEYLFAPIIFETIEAAPMLAASFQYRYVDYIVKPFTLDYLTDRFRVVFDVLNSAREKKTFLDIKTKFRKRRIEFNDIVYISTFMKGSKIFTTHGEYSIPTPFKSLPYEFDIRFVQCHQSYIVNCFHIKSVDYTNDIITLIENNEKIPISRRHKKDFMEIVSNF